MEDRRLPQHGCKAGSARTRSPLVSSLEPLSKYSSTICFLRDGLGQMLPRTVTMLEHDP
jgi:hypothetical protein